jgi:membrane associated rhomboid family serine protease
MASFEFSVTQVVVLAATSGFVCGVALFYLVMRRTQKHMARRAAAEASGQA